MTNFETKGILSALPGAAWRGFEHAAARRFCAVTNL